MLYEIGRICVKLAGRDSGKKCVIVDVIDDVYVLIDGQTRRRKCNVAHLEPLATTLVIKKGADSATVAKAFEKLDLTIVTTKPKKAGVKPTKHRASAKVAVKTEKKSKEKAPKSV